MTQYSVILKNRNGKKFTVKENEPIFNAIEKKGYILPIGCRYGGCITCAAKLIKGKVRQPNATALNKRQAKLGYILLCVARPKTDCILEVGVEAHDKLYQNPFAVKPDCKIKIIRKIII